MGVLTPPQEIIYNDPSRFRVIVAGRRFGKALEVSTPIPTPSGFRAISEIAVGDFVYSPQGLPIEVVDTSGVFSPEKAYRLYFSDGTEVVCDSSHEWFTYTKLDRKYIPRGKSKPSVKTTQDIVDTLTHNGESNHAVEVASPISGESSTLSIDPYVFGQWLGDGTSRCAQITTGDDLEDYFTSAGYTLEERASSGKAKTYQISHKVRGHFVKALEEILSRVGGKFTKDIPEAYLFSSEADRLALLQGLMDSDGYAAKSLNQCEFTSMSEVLASKVRTLVASLGMKPTLKTYPATLNGEVVGTKYRVFFHANRPVFRLKRKLSRLALNKKQTNYSRFRYITGFEEVKGVEVCCIQVDSDDHLYLATESFISTHNSVLSLNEILRALQVAPDQHVYYIAPYLKMARGIMWPMLMEAIPRHMIAHQDKNDLSVTLKGFNSTIHLCGADNPDSLRGITINFLVADEIQDIPLEVIDMILRPAMGTTMADGIYIGTPKGKGNNTAYQLYLRGKTLPDWKSWHFTTEEGGNVPREEIESARQTMTKKQFDQEYLASFTTMLGRVYYAFDMDDTVRGDIVDNGDEIHIGMDFNVGKMCAVCCQVDDGKVYVFDEIVLMDSNTREMCVEIARRFPNRKITVYPDASGKSRKTSANAGQSDFSIITSEFGFGLQSPPKNPPVADRVNSLNSMLQAADGTRKLFVSKTCKEVIMCLDGQVYKEGTNAPDKQGELDHMNDALGYFINYKFSLIKREVKMLTLDWTY